jgi:hypothetical protein
MKKKFLRCIVGMLALTLFMTGSALADSIIGFASAAGSSLIFSGGAFSFTPAADGTNFFIQSSQPLSTTGTGTIGGSYTIGAVQAGGIGLVATATGTGAFTIHDSGDPVGVNFTATVNWIQISTGPGDNGNVGGLNPVLQANLTGLSYTGSNQELQYLFSIGTSTIGISWNNPIGNLNTLAAAGTNGNPAIATNYSGNIAPIPGTALLLGSGLFGMAALGWRSRRKP